MKKMQIVFIILFRIQLLISQYMYVTVFFENDAKGVLHLHSSNQKLACNVLYLKIINPTCLFEKW